jgi:hypothetical protein
MQSHEYDLGYDDAPAYGDDEAAAYDAAFLGDDGDHRPAEGVDFDDPKIASLPRILLMGPRRSGKTSIEVSVCCALRKQ